MGRKETILLTGASGLLGNEILAALLRADSEVEILALIRGEVGKPEDKFKRLVPKADRDEFAKRVKPVWGNIERDKLGLPPHQFEELAERVTCVIHSAAAVDFALPYDAARSANLDGTVKLVDLAKRSKNLRAFAHISTAHVAGRRTGFVAEEELEHKSGFVNFYEQTKYETEVFLRHMMSEMPIAVYRSTTLIGDSRDGTVKQYNFFHNAVRLYYQGLVPALPGDPLGHLDLIPVDWAASVIRHLVMGNFRAGTTYHVCAGPSSSFNLQQLIDATLEAFESSPHSDRRIIKKPPIVSKGEFDALVSRALEEGHGIFVQLLKPLGYFMPHLSLPKVFGAENLHRDLPSDGSLVVPDVREYYPKIVNYCLKTRWGRS